MNYDELLERLEKVQALNLPENEAARLRSRAYREYEGAVKAAPHGERTQQLLKALKDGGGTLHDLQERIGPGVRITTLLDRLVLSGEVRRRQVRNPLRGRGQNAMVWYYEYGKEEKE